MSFTQNRLEFANDITYDEIANAMAYGKGIPSFVVKGLDLTGTTLTNGIFTNTGTFGQLGATGETYTIPANYTGYIVIKSTLNGVNSVSTIELSATRNDSDPTIVSNIKYFTIYKLNNGVIEEDYRHSSYVKDISFENVGGSSFVQVINGTKSNPFDASVFAGNRTLLNDKDISYNDAIHSASLLQDILLDLFNKARLNVGTDKPFIICFGADPDGILANIGTAIKNFITTKYGYTIPNNTFNFKMTSITLGTSTNSAFGVLNKVEVWSDGFSFEFPFDYDNFDNVKVLDRNGYKQAKGTVLYTASGGYNNDTNITLSESLLNFDTICVEWKSAISFTTEFNMRSQADDGVTKIRHADTQGYNYYDETNQIWYSYTDRVSFSFLSATSIGVVSTGAGKYVIRDMGRNNETSDVVLDEGYGIVKVIGLNRRAVPRTSIDTASLLREPQIETPNIEPEIDNGVRGDK